MRVSAFPRQHIVIALLVSTPICGTRCNAALQSLAGGMPEYGRATLLDKLDETAAAIGRC